MSNLIPLAIADLELQLATSVAVGSESFTLSSSYDDDGVALPSGKYCFTVDNGTSAKEYLMGQLNGTAVTSVKSVSRQGVETTGAVRKHRIGAPVILTDFATIQRVADILRGQLDLDGASPVGYDAEPTLTDRKDLATVGYVLDTVTGGTVAFDKMTVAGNGGEAIVAGNLVYFKTSDQEWYLTDADTAATVEGVQLGIALGTGSNGVAITGGVQVMGTWTTTGLTPGATYYAGNTAGAISASAGTTKQSIGVALSSTKLLLIPRGPNTVTSLEKDIIDSIEAGTYFSPMQVVKFTSSGTWTKDAGLKYVVVEVVGGGGGSDTDAEDTAGAGAGGYSRKLILASSLGATETVTVGAGGVAGSTPTAGGTSSFGAHCSANGGGVSTWSYGPGSGGTATGGDINVRGGAGTPSDTVSVGNNENGSGGNSYFGGGGAGGRNTSESGEANSGGGGGGRQNGGSGIVIVTEYYI